MKPPWYRTGATGWIVMGTAVLTWDLLAPDNETLSEAFRKVKRHPVVLIGLILTIAHLFEWLPKKVDPLHSIHALRDRSRSRHVHMV